MASLRVELPIPERRGRRAQQRSRVHHAWYGGHAGVGARVRPSRPGERRGARWVREGPAGGHDVVPRDASATNATPTKRLARGRPFGCASTRENAKYFFAPPFATYGFSSSSIYQIPNTEHMAYRLVRTLVYKSTMALCTRITPHSCEVRPVLYHLLCAMHCPFSPRRSFHPSQTISATTARSSPAATSSSQPPARVATSSRRHQLVSPACFSSHRSSASPPSSPASTGGTAPTSLRTRSGPRSHATWTRCSATRSSNPGLTGQTSRPAR